MPVYEYQCQSCGIRFEKHQRFSDEPLTECPECGGTLYKVIQPVGVIFKGSGFYVTDNRGKSSTTPPARKDSDSAGSSDSAGGDDKAGSAESKKDAAQPQNAAPVTSAGDTKTG